MLSLKSILFNNYLVIYYYAECSYAKCHHYAECCYANCHYAECRYAA
jgi:hypothetical protein